jgi:CheY-like chemotaxis protein
VKHIQETLRTILSELVALDRIKVGETPRVLLVEDNPDDAMLIRRELKESCNITWVQTGEQALQLIAKLDKSKNAYHIVFLDLGLPGMDGMETFKKIRETQNKLPVVLVTGSNYTQPMVNDAIKLGYAGVVLKEFKSSLNG